MAAAIASIQAKAALRTLNDSGLRDHVGTLLAEHVDPAHVVVVALGEHDRPERPAADRLVGPPMHRTLEPHARVDEDPAVVRREQVRVGESGRHEDVVSQGDGRLTPTRGDGVRPRPLAVDPSHQATSGRICGNASK
jgi:hypothetical protein